MFFVCVGVVQVGWFGGCLDQIGLVLLLVVVVVVVLADYGMVYKGWRLGGEGLF